MIPTPTECRRAVIGGQPGWVLYFGAGRDVLGYVFDGNEYDETPIKGVSHRTDGGTPG